MANISFNALRELFVIAAEIRDVHDELIKAARNVINSTFYKTIIDDVRKTIDDCLKYYNTISMPAGFSSNEINDYNKIVTDFNARRTLLNQKTESINYQRIKDDFQSYFVELLALNNTTFDNVMYDVVLRKFYRKGEDGEYTLLNNKRKADFEADSMYTERMTQYIENCAKPFKQINDCSRRSRIIADKVMSIIDEPQDFSQYFEKCNQVREIIEDCAKKWDGKDYITGAASYHFSTKNTTYNNVNMFAFLCQALYNMLSLNANHRDLIFIVESAQGIGKSYLFTKFRDVVFPQIFKGLISANEVSLSNVDAYRTYTSGFGLSSIIENMLYTIFSDPAPLSEAAFDTFTKHITKPTLSCNDKNQALRDVPSYASKIMSWNVRIPVKIDYNSRRIKLFRGLDLNVNFEETIKPEINTALKNPFDVSNNYQIFFQLFYQCCHYVLNHEYTEFEKIIDSVTKIRKAAAANYVREQNAALYGEFYKIIVNRCMTANYRIKYEELKEIWNTMTNKGSLYKLQATEEFKRIFDTKRENGNRIYQINSDELLKANEKYNALQYNDTDNSEDFEYQNFEDWKKDIIAYQEKIKNGPTFTDSTPRFVYDDGILSGTKDEITSNSNSLKIDDFTDFDMIDNEIEDEEVNDFADFDMIDSSEEEYYDEDYGEVWSLIDTKNDTFDNVFSQLNESMF